MRYNMIGVFLASVLLVSVVWTHLALGKVSDAGQGEEVYEMYCVMCHGVTGKGDGALAVDLTPPSADLTREAVQNYSDEELLTIIRKGRPGTSMPAWEGDLSNQDILNVFSYVRSLRQK